MLFEFLSSVEHVVLVHTIVAYMPSFDPDHHRSHASPHLTSVCMHHHHRHHQHHHPRCTSNIEAVECFTDHLRQTTNTNELCDGVAASSFEAENLHNAYGELEDIDWVRLIRL
jgi:hypothetical protein